MAATCLSRIWSFALILSIYTSGIVATVSPLCPTVTKTTHHPSCPLPTPSFCPQPACVLLSRLSVPCGCPTTVPTATSYTACPTICQGSCGTAYETDIASCPSTKPSPTPTTITTVTKSNSCATITQTTGSACPTLTGCTTADCIYLKTVTLQCGCSSIGHVTSCQTACSEACATSWNTVYVPCAASPPSVVGGPVTALGD